VYIVFVGEQLRTLGPLGMSGLDLVFHPLDGAFQIVGAQCPVFEKKCRHARMAKGHAQRGQLGTGGAVQDSSLRLKRQLQKQFCLDADGRTGL
jgi:hypothetical protein